MALYIVFLNKVFYKGEGNMPENAVLKSLTRTPTELKEMEKEANNDFI